MDVENDDCDVHGMWIRTLHLPAGTLWVVCSMDYDKNADGRKVVGKFVEIEIAPLSSKSKRRRSCARDHGGERRFASTLVSRK